jgi:acyl-CoA reductase-like NAD-dependent aldehyde dehydrogenase
MRFSPGDLSIEIPTLPEGDVETAVQRAGRAFAEWRELSIEARATHLKAAQQQIEDRKEELASGIALETGKPITEARGEIGAVIAKIDLAIADAQRYLSEHVETDNPHPNLVRRRPRGVAAVIGPFNFPIHLAHGAITAYLLAGNTVVFKPSPFAANVCQTYAELMIDALPRGVFEIVQGGAEIGQALVADRRVRSVCFTGSVGAGRAIARACAEDVGKDVALELGGKNAAVVLADADIDLAAASIADAMCLTAGQRCNSTSRVIVDPRVEHDLVDLVREKITAYAPGDPLDRRTKLGPLVSETAKVRYLQAISGSEVEWVTSVGAPEDVAGRRGHYVLPAVGRAQRARVPSLSLWREEVFAPVCVITTAPDDAAVVELVNATDFGLTTSVFTVDRDRFMRLSSRFDVGNVYCNLPTTFSPGTLPFGGLKQSGNHHPGGRGFVRFAGDEQVVQIKE